MCGIAGLVVPREGAPIDPIAVRAMGETLQHRGHDDFQIWSSDHAALSVNQFKIFSSEENRQPVVNEDESVVVACNGEIYNFVTLQKSLLERGHHLTCAYDVEVIPHLYEEYGDDFVDHLSGMFALALYDRKKHRLLLVRDRLGIKPLYLTHLRDGVAFASELKALMALPGFDARVNEQAAWDYLSFGYVPAPSCILGNVVRIPAGSKVVIKDSRIRSAAYWDVPPLAERSVALTEAATETKRLLCDSVSECIHGDLPVGLMLSGGMDSGLLLHILSKLEGRHGQVHTYCATFAESGYSEGSRARANARRYGAVHHEIPITADLLSELPRLVWHLDGLSINAPSLAHLAIAREARGHTPVLLTGEGSDELFFGYETYAATSLVNRWGKIIGPFAGVVADPLFRIPPFAGKAIGLDYMIKNFLKGLSMDPLRAHVYWREYFMEEQRKN